MTQHVNAAPTPRRQLRADVPAELEELVLHLLRKAPEARPTNVQEVYERLRPFLPPPSEESVPQGPEPVGVPDPTAIFRHPYAPRSRAATASAGPAVHAAATEEAELAPLVTRVRAWMDAGVHPGEIGVSTRFNKTCVKAVTHLKAAGIPASLLAGRPADRRAGASTWRPERQPRS